MSALLSHNLFLSGHNSSCPRIVEGRSLQACLMPLSRFWPQSSQSCFFLTRSSGLFTALCTHRPRIVHTSPRFFAGQPPTQALERPAPTRPSGPRSAKLARPLCYLRALASYPHSLACSLSVAGVTALRQLSSSQEVLVLAALGPRPQVARIGESRDRPSRARCPACLEGRS